MNTTDKAHLSKYVKYLKKYPVQLWISIALIPTITAITVLQPYLIKVGIDHHIIKKDWPGLIPITLLFGACVVIEFLSKAIQSYLFAYIGQKSVSDIRRDLFSHILKLPSHFFDQTPLGIITARLTNDIETLNESIASGLVTLIGDLLTLISIIVMMFLLSPKLTLITLCIIPILFLIVNHFRIVLRDAFNKSRTLIGKKTGYLQEQIQGISTIQLFQREYQNFQEYKVMNKAYKESVVKAVTYDALLYSIIEALSSIVIAGLIWVACGSPQTSIISLGLLIAFIEYIRKFFTPLKELSTKFVTLQHALSALEKIFNTFSIETEKETGTQTLSSPKGHIQLKNIHFSYPGEDQKPVLNGVSFELTPGSVVAIVGSSGSGKTTLSKLLLRLYTPTSGSITLDGIPIQNLTLKNLREQFSTVTQEIYLLPETIAFNIGFNQPGITQDDIQNAAKAVGVHDLIQKLPNGYNTWINTSNHQLSKGEAQLITLARVLCAKAPIVLMDEATASVDTIWEKKIEKAVQTILQKKSVLVIAHRLSTIQKVGTILAMRDGQIIETGSHEQLMDQKGFYYALFNMQFKS